MARGASGTPSRSGARGEHPAASEARQALHTVAPGESVQSLSWRYLPASVYLTRTELVNAIRSANSLKRDALRPGEQVVIPGIPAQPVRDRATAAFALLTLVELKPL